MEGRALRPKPSMEEGKLSTYVCGGDISGKKVQYSYHLFHFAFPFTITILYVAALMIAAVSSGSIGHYLSAYRLEEAVILLID